MYWIRHTTRRPKTATPPAGTPNHGTSEYLRPVSHGDNHRSRKSALAYCALPKNLCPSSLYGVSKQVTNGLKRSLVRYRSGVAKPVLRKDLKLS